MLVMCTNALHQQQQGGYNNFNQNQFNRVQPFQGARQQNFQQNFNQQPQFQVKWLSIQLNWFCIAISKKKIIFKFTYDVHNVPRVM